jgi:4'-phosphopantetheinyl transferase
MNIYIYQKDPATPLTSDEMIRSSLRAYNRETGLGLIDSFFDEAPIIRTSKGKPYVDRIPIHFSLSHSGNLMICAVGKKEIGIDIQHIRHARTIEVAQRFFSTEESDYVNLYGEEAFFELWSRKEAFVKYIGEGIAYGFQNFNLVHKGQIVDRIEKPTFCQFQMIPLGPEVKCCICTRKRERIWIKKL